MSQFQQGEIIEKFWTNVMFWITFCNVVLQSKRNDKSIIEIYSAVTLKSLTRARLIVSLLPASFALLGLASPLRLICAVATKTKLSSLSCFGWPPLRPLYPIGKPNSSVIARGELLHQSTALFYKTMLLGGWKIIISFLLLPLSCGSAVLLRSHKTCLKGGKQYTYTDRV